jgi:FemAB family protein
MRKHLTQIIRNDIADYVDITQLEWRSVLDQIDVIPSVYYLSSTVRYYVAYYAESDAINLSIVLYNNKQPVGIMPLMVHYSKCHSSWVLSSNGIEIIEPIFIEELARNVKKNLESQLIKVLFYLSEYLSIEKIQCVNMEYNKLTKWHLNWASKAEEMFSTNHLLVDLTMTIDKIRLNFRKSFKPLINKSLREWHVEVHEGPSQDLFKQFKLLHEEVSGRVTRSVESWDIQKIQINSKEAFMVAVFNKKEELAGVGFFTYTSYQGMYCVGAYKRELFNKPIGHAVQMKAIEVLKKKGCKWYEIGQKHLKIDKISPTDKELSITHFKEGFSTHVIARQHLIVNISKIDQAIA